MTTNKKDIFKIISTLIFFAVNLNNIVYGGNVYIDQNKKPLLDYQVIGEKVEKIYGVKLNRPVTVIFKETPGGRFNCESNEIFINQNDPLQKKLVTIAHETSHLMHCQITNNKSTNEELRFVDEGLASIIGQRITGDEDSYKAQTKEESALERDKGNVSFELVKKWKKYFGTGNIATSNWKAYRVGSSFIYYLIYKYGEGTPFDFLKYLERSSFQEALLKTTGNSEQEIEVAWLEYIYEQGKI
ncbi:MAG: hypothetical protein A2381_13950 [Bdellovibrionales bacterium RIFOXYB1_FULL_37_110]|nr:MAG: hypothetical protein A2181_06500 [Bdellovibrionales bacterium RIFOXYA1_FULL_38_20]OFZ52162.1 MAG: hypothetical protein A2417_13195 [Bdellovibrionales bacterium RIFOXYC1_FULL_37_79]OFZ58698.1 MAG: hypothetical protein A2381_13950 [Bdellovibrionales bacterium RIFOXYB1_FULL_37_110]OFZ63484.1 MAG: hypothetical protein A2577_06355 [Bdellovibrionales bacterium RIFOXYD1_FULL_36_51]